MFLSKESLTEHVLTVDLHFPNTFENPSIVFSKCKNLVTCSSHGKPEPLHNRPNSFACHKLGMWCPSSGPFWIGAIHPVGWQCGIQTLPHSLNTKDSSFRAAVGKGECAAGSMLKTCFDRKIV